MGKENFTLQPKEKGRIPKYTPLYDVIMVTGEAGTGKSTLAEALAREHNATYINIGGIVRKINEKVFQDPTIGARKSNPEIDKKINRLIELIIRNANYSENGHAPRKPVIVDSRMGALIARTEKQKAQENGDSFPNVIAIKLTASPEVAARRIAIRNNIPYEDAYEKTLERNEGDRTIFNDVLPDYLKGSSPYDDHLFNFVQDTSVISQHEVVKKVNRWLINNKFLRKAN